MPIDERTLVDEFDERIDVEIAPHGLRGLLRLPLESQGIVIFAHGSGSGRFSARNNHVAERLHRAGWATLLLDLLTLSEEQDRRNVFDVQFLAQRLVNADSWARKDPRTHGLAVGYFGASTGAAAALIAAATPDSRARAVVSRGGRPDLALAALPHVPAPTLLIVGGLDDVVIDLNRAAFAQLKAPKELVIVPGAGHLFEEPGTLDAVVAHAVKWFGLHLRENANVQ